MEGARAVEEEGRKPHTLTLKSLLFLVDEDSDVGWGLIVVGFWMEM